MRVFSAMRRLVLEMSQDEISKFSPSAALLDKIESLEVIYHLRFDKDGFAGICKIKIKDPKLDLRRLVGVGGLVRLEILSNVNNEYVVYMETRTRNMAWFRDPDAPEVFLCPPIEFKDGRLKLTFVGNLNEVKRLLARAEKVGQNFKVLSLTDARFSPDSVLHKLTERQRSILSAAYSQGYYDVPRRIGSEELAQKLQIVKSTLVEHLRKAEKRLITDIMGKEEDRIPLSLVRK